MQSSDSQREKRKIQRLGLAHILTHTCRVVPLLQLMNLHGHIIIIQGHSWHAGSPPGGQAFYGFWQKCNTGVPALTSVLSLCLFTHDPCDGWSSYLRVVPPESECPRAGILQSAAFPYWLLTLGEMLVSSLLADLFLYSLESFCCLNGPPFIYPFTYKDILVALKFW